MHCAEGYVPYPKYADNFGTSIANLINGLEPNKLWLMPNTAGCQTAEEAIRVAFLGREISKNLGFIDNNFIKLEVIPDPKYLMPDSTFTLINPMLYANAKFCLPSNIIHHLKGA